LKHARVVRLPLYMNLVYDVLITCQLSRMAASGVSDSAYCTAAAMGPPEVNAKTVLPLPCSSMIRSMEPDTRAENSFHVSTPGLSDLPDTHRSMASSKTLLNDSLLLYMSGK